MPSLKLESFSGIVPRTGSTLLQDNQAQIASNVKLQSGELRPWRSTNMVYQTTVTNVKTVYKFQGPAGINPIFLEWAQDVDITPGPVADTGDFRLYYTGAGTPKKTNWLLASGEGVGVPPFPNGYYEMGTPAPTGGPILSAAGTGTAPVETRAYVYTHVTEFGTVAEESAPSPANLVTCNFSGDAVTLSGFSTLPTGNYNFKYRRIYRTVSGNAATTYQLVAEIPIAQSSYVDTKSVTALGSVITSLYYTPPPNDLTGIISMPNGIMAGFRGSEIWFCEPYLPHAWPDIYVLTTEFPIVGLGVFGNSLVVGTTKQPYVVTGSSPSSMGQDKLPMIQPCVSKKSIASDQFGVIYASPNGLVSIGPGTQNVITQALYTRDEWQLLNPQSMIGALYNNMYFGFYKVGSVYNSLVIQRADQPPLVNFYAPASYAFVEPTTGFVHYLSPLDNRVYTLDTNTTTNTTYQWRSKRFLLGKPLNYAALQVHADYAYLAANAGSSINIKLYADGATVFDGNITSEFPVRLAGGFKAYNWEIEVNSNVPVRRVSIATSSAELSDI